MTNMPRQDEMSHLIETSTITIARQWKNILYRIKGKLSMLIAQEHGKKQLKIGTPERLREEILEDCERLHRAQAGLNQETRRDVYTLLANKQFLFEGTNRKNPTKQVTNIKSLLELAKTPHNTKHIQTCLEVVGVTSSSIDAILLDPIFQKRFSSNATPH